MLSLQPEGVSEFNVSNPEVSDGNPNMDGNIAGLKGDGKGANVSSAKTRCSRCGQRDDGSKCTTDLSKKRCFKCHEFGHISTNCRGDAKNSKGSGKPNDGRKSDGKVLLHLPKVVSPKVRGVRRARCLLFLMIPWINREIRPWPLKAAFSKLNSLTALDC